MFWKVVIGIFQKSCYNEKKKILFSLLDSCFIYDFLSNFILIFWYTDGFVSTHCPGEGQVPPMLP